MIKLRNEVFVADQKNGNVNAALKNLQQYVYSHMNTNLDSSSSVHPPIQLQYTYERLVQAEKTRVEAANSQLYTQAQIACQQQIPQGFSGRGRVPCIDDYVTSHGVKGQTVLASLYQFDFVSPHWTPDLAGWSLFTTIVLFVVFCLRYIAERLTRHALRKQL